MLAELYGPSCRFAGDSVRLFSFATQPAPEKAI